MMIASYWASMGIRVDKKSVALVDTTLNRLEQKLRNFGKLAGKNLKINFDISSFTVDQRKLNTAMGLALDIASTRNVFQVSRFSIDQQALNRSMSNATQIASRQAKGSINVRASVNQAGQGRIEPRHAVAAGGIGGIAARGYAPAIALAGGAYGLGALNKRNQEVVAAQMQTQAVVQQFGGTKQQGVQSFEWLKGQADRIGFNYLDATGDYNRLVSGLMGTGGTLEGSQDVFRGFSEFGRTNKLGAVQMKRIYKALGDVAGKNQLQAEELTNQFGDSLPGATALFAQAYQDKLLAEGKISTRMSEQDAVTKLRADMKKGLVKGDILGYAGKRASTMAQPGLEAASKASQAEQARFQNALNNQAVTASNAGVESGFARIFKSLAVAMEESTPIVEGLAKTFDEISKYVSFATLLPQSFKRAFEGRDSWVTDTLGTETVANLKSFISSMSDVFKELKKLTSTILDGWGMLVPSIVAFANKVADVFKYTFKMFNALLPGGEGVDAAANYGRAMQASLSGKTPEEVAAIAAGQEFRPNVANPLESAYGAMNSYNNLPAPQGLLEHMAYRSEQSRLGEEYRLAKIAETQNKDSIYYNDPKGFDAMVNDRMKAQAFDQAYRGGNSSQVNINSGAIVINANTSDPQALSDTLMSTLRQEADKMFVTRLDTTMLSFPQGE